MMLLQHMDTVLNSSRFSAVEYISTSILTARECSSSIVFITSSFTRKSKILSQAIHDDLSESKFNTFVDVHILNDLDMLKNRVSMIPPHVYMIICQIHTVLDTDQYGSCCCDIITIRDLPQEDADICNSHVEYNKVSGVQYMNINSLLAAYRVRRVQPSYSIPPIPFIKVLNHSTSHDLFPHSIPIHEQSSFGKLVFQEKSTSITSLHPRGGTGPTQPKLEQTVDNIKVWTAPAPTSSVEYMLSLLRAAKFCPGVYLALAPILSQKLAFISRISVRNTKDHDVHSTPTGIDIPHTVQLYTPSPTSALHMHPAFLNGFLTALGPVSSDNGVGSSTIIGGSVLGHLLSGEQEKRNLVQDAVNCILAVYKNSVAWHTAGCTVDNHSTQDNSMVSTDGTSTISLLECIQSGNTSHSQSDVAAIGTHEWLKTIVIAINRAVIELPGHKHKALWVALDGCKFLPHDVDMLLMVARSSVAIGNKPLGLEYYQRVLSYPTATPMHKQEASYYIQRQTHQFHQPQLLQQTDRISSMENHVFSSCAEEYQNCGCVSHDRVIENEVRLSASILWSLQKQYYEERGLNAWSTGEERRRANQVPYYMTSNSYIAKESALVMLAAIIDAHSSGKLDVLHPLFILEGGCGNGKFAALFVNHLNDLIVNGVASGVTILSHLKVVYILSDTSSACFDSFLHSSSDLSSFLIPRAGPESVPSTPTVSTLNLQSSPSLCPEYNPSLVAEATPSAEELRSRFRHVSVDFAVFDCEKSSEIHCLRSGTTLTESSPSHNPIVFIANYLFDSLSADAFKVTLDKTTQSPTLEFQLSKSMSSPVADSPHVLSSDSVYSSAPMVSGDRCSGRLYECLLTLTQHDDTHQDLDDPRIDTHTMRSTRRWSCEDVSTCSKSWTHRPLWDLELPLSTKEDTTSGPYFNTENGVLTSNWCDNVSIDGNISMCTNYYAEPELNDVLNICAKNTLIALHEANTSTTPAFTSRTNESGSISSQQSSACFTIPCGGLRCLLQLRKMTARNELLSLVADKGFNRESMFVGMCEPSIAYHGSLSIAVNMKAISNLTSALRAPLTTPTSNHSDSTVNGFGILTSCVSSPLDVCMIGIGLSRQDLSLTASIFDRGIGSLGVNDLMVLRDHIEDTATTRQTNSSNTSNDDEEERCIYIPVRCVGSSHSAGVTLTAKRTLKQSCLSVRAVQWLCEVSGWDADVIQQFTK